MSEKTMERGHQMQTMKAMTRACALSATAAAATLLLAGNAAAADDDVLTRKRPAMAMEHVAAAVHHPTRLLVDFTHQRATQWAFLSDASAEQVGEADQAD